MKKKSKGAQTAQILPFSHNFTPFSLLACFHRKVKYFFSGLSQLCTFLSRTRHPRYVVSGQIKITTAGTKFLIRQKTTKTTGKI